MRKQNKKTYPSRIRSSGGQTTLQTFLFKPRVADGELNPYPPPPPAVAEDDEIPNSPPAPPKREIVRVTNKTIREKASAFSSVGSSARRGTDASALNAAVFKRFNGSSPPAAKVGGAAAAEAGGDADDGGGDGGVRLDVEDIAAGSRRWESRKRKSPFGGNEGRTSSNAGHVVVLGDDPKPRPPPATRGRGRIAGRGGGNRALYNHYASGGGLWQGEQEGVDGEEVGWTEDMWEGMGSITLGGMEWH